MMGTRAKLDGLETDAFSRRARRILKFRPGEKRKAKAKFWRKRRVEERSDLNLKSKEI